MALGSSKHHNQIKISLCVADAEDIVKCAQKRAMGTGTFVRLLVVQHLATREKEQPNDSDLGPMSGVGVTTFNSHIAVLLSDEEYGVIGRLAFSRDLTLSGYLRRCIIEPWLRRLRNSHSAGERR